MNHKTVIITGANSGIGMAAATRFAKEGCSVIMACRDMERSKIVQQQIIELTKNPRVDLMQVDISSFSSIRDFCSRFREKYDRLDILINNAGHFAHGEKNYQLSQDNIELTFAVNAFGPFLMTMMLTDALEKSDDARVLNACTTNIRHFFDDKRKIDFDNIEGENTNKSYNSYKMYGDSKMALLMLTFKMAEHLEEIGIKIYAVQIPAVKITKNTIKKLKSVWRAAASIQNLFSMPTQSMADIYYYICTSNKLFATTGKLINVKGGVMKPSKISGKFTDEFKQLFDNEVYPRYASNPENIQKVWDLALKLTNFIK